MAKCRHVAALCLYRSAAVGGLHPHRQISWSTNISAHSDTAVLMVFTAFLGVLALPAIWLFDPKVLALPWLATGVMTVSGILYMGAMLFYLRAIQSEEASVVAPLFQANTVFTFLLGLVFLHELPRWQQLAGAGAGGRRRAGTVAGQEAALWQLQAQAGAADVRRHLRAGAVQRGVQVLRGAGRVLEHHLLDLCRRRPVRRRHPGGAANTASSSPHLFRKNPGAVIGVNAANELINLGGGLGVRYASLLAPVGLVSAISATSTFFVFLFGILLTLFFPRIGREDLSARNVYQKAVGGVLIMAGVVLIQAYAGTP